MGREEQEEEEWRCRLCDDVGVTVRLWYLTCDARMEALLSLADIPTSVRKAPPLKLSLASRQSPLGVSPHRALLLLPPLLAVRCGLKCSDGTFPRMLDGGLDDVAVEEAEERDGTGGKTVRRPMLSEMPS